MVTEGKEWNTDPVDYAVSYIVQLIALGIFTAIISSVLLLAGASMGLIFIINIIASAIAIILLFQQINSMVVNMIAATEQTRGDVSEIADQEHQLLQYLDEEGTWFLRENFVSILVVTLVALVVLGILSIIF